MKTTGIVRKIDELGRIVIPKEIRKNLRIRFGDPVEIYVDSEKVILKKYSPMGDILEISKHYAEALSKTTGYVTIITSADTIVAVYGKGSSEYMNKNISVDLHKIMEYREIWTTKGESPIKITDDDINSKYVSQVVAPIISDSDVIGTVVIFSKETGKIMTEVEYKLVQLSAIFLGRQME